MIETTGNDIVVIASDPQELAEGQMATIAKVKEKQAAAVIELRQTQAVLDSAKNHRLAVAVPTRLVVKAKNRLMFLDKVVDALEAGYVIVPNFPGETVAIRVKRQRPRFNVTESTYSRDSADRSMSDERGEVLPAGEGRYVSPTQIVTRSTYTRTREGKPDEKVYKSTAIALNDQIGLPVEFLRPTVVERTGKMMMRRVFDEIAISRNTVWNRKGDPMVIGRLVDRSRSNTYLSFLVAWFIDTSTI